MSFERCEEEAFEVTSSPSVISSTAMGEEVSTKNIAYGSEDIRRFLRVKKSDRESKDPDSKDKKEEPHKKKEKSDPSRKVKNESSQKEIESQPKNVKAKRHRKCVPHAALPTPVTTPVPVDDTVCLSFGIPIETPPTTFVVVERQGRRIVELRDALGNAVVTIPVLMMTT